MYIGLVAILILVVQYPLSKGMLRREYKEDWKRYAIFFYGFEIIILLIILIFANVVRSLDLLSDPGSFYTLLLMILVVMILVVSMTLLLKRRYTYGQILFTHDDWAGVSIKNDLFSKVPEGDYVVKRGGVKVNAGDRVKVLVERKPFGRTRPASLMQKL